MTDKQIETWFRDLFPTDTPKYKEVSLEAIMYLVNKIRDDAKDQITEAYVRGVEDTSNELKKAFKS